MKSKGFTLIELLVVIAIVAMLAAILVPAVQKARMNLKNKESFNGNPPQQSTFNPVFEEPEKLEKPEPYNGERPLQPGESRYYVTYSLGANNIGACIVIVNRDIKTWDSMYGPSNSLVSEASKYGGSYDGFIVQDYKLLESYLIPENEEVQ